MARYTIELYKLVNSGYPLFDESWNTFDPAHKKELIDKILKTYWFYEIGQETPDRFKHYLNLELQTIMPYYNQLYASELLKIEPLYNSIMETERGIARSRQETEALSKRQDLKRAFEMAKSMRSKDVNNTIDTGHLDGKFDSSVIRDKDYTENTDEQWDTTTDRTQTEKQTFSDTKDHTETTDKTHSMTKEETSSGHEDSTGSSDTKTSSNQQYAETPQRNLSTGAINLNYLTNYTQNSGTDDTDTTGHKEAENTTNTTQNDTEKIDVVGKDTEESTTDKSITENITESKTGNKDIKGTEDETTTRKDTTTEDTRSTSDFTGEVNELESGSEWNKENIIGMDSRQTDEHIGESTKTTVKGLTMSQSELLLKYRETFLNIDREIITQLADCFMGIF